MKDIESLRWITTFSQNFFSLHYKLEEDIITIHDNNGYEIEPENVMLLIEYLKKAYDIQNEDLKERIYRRIANREIAIKESIYIPYTFEKEFRENLKRNWGFKCEICKEVVSSKSHKSYWKLNGSNYLHDKYCSKKCAESVANNLRESIEFEVYNKYGLLNE